MYPEKRIQFILLFSLCLGLLTLPLHAAPNWRASDYKRTNLANYKKHPALKRTIDFDHVDYKALNAAIFYETNARRKQAGLPELAHHPLLESMAFNHSRHMVQNNYFAHVDPGSNATPLDRLKKLKVKNPYPAENIALNFGLNYSPNREVFTPGKGKFSYEPNGALLQPHSYLSLAKALLDQWMDSPSHKKNILSEKGKQMGCGAYLFFKKDFNDMPMFKATQNFQWFELLHLKQ